MKWPPYRYAAPNLIAAVLLALAGGWTAFSGVMAISWLLYPEQKQNLVEAISERHLILFPPLFGSSPFVYMAAVLSILFLCGAAVLLLRLKTKTTKEKRPS